MSKSAERAASRRAQLLEVARALFFGPQGYEGTTVQQLQEAAAISRGAFYHHFESKEALLLALAQELTKDGLTQLTALVEDDSKGPTAKLNAFFAASRRFKREHAAAVRQLMEVLWRPQNLALRHALLRAQQEQIGPLLARIIAQGVGQGQMLSEDAAASAQLLLHMSQGLSEGFMQELSRASGDAAQRAASIEAMEARVEVFERGVERFLGMDPQTLSLYEPGLIAALVCG